ncbi:MAG TPA: large conductance mechanosensitive channel protein MscL [Ktedonobacterales bacterium]
MATTKRAMSAAGSATRGAGSLLTEFKAFILRGNVVDLAIAFVIGAAFAAIVDALVKDIIMPMLAALGGKPTFDQYYWTINGSKILVGSFLTAVVSFIIIAAVIFFFVIKPLNYLLAHRKSEVPPDPTTRECPFCLSDIPLQASRCAFCTSEVPALATVEVK